jgi:stage IV sporulation protein FB
MSDPLTWSPISLGRWFGTAVRVHILLILFVATWLIASVVSPGGESRLAHLSHTACWLGLLMFALALHELGHAVAAAWLECDQDEVHLWPLGNLVGPSFKMRSGEHYWIALAGPITSAALFMVTAISLKLFAGTQVVWLPFGNGKPDFGAPWVAKDVLASPLSGAWMFGWFAYWNWVLLLANIIPALPFDAGRAVRAWQGSTSAIASRDNPVPFWLARGLALIIGVGGLLRLIFYSWGADGWSLIGVALVIEYMVRVEARMLEEGGYFDDGVFGYDFSEGYTSLEGGTAAVRPHPESALKRWRRRRSELRRQRRMAREAAEERRMDEILEKLYREGRAALTDEENRFLVRVSVRFRNRTKHT